MYNQTSKKGLFKHWQLIAIYLLIFDVFSICASYFAALLIRYDFKFNQINPEYIINYKRFMPIYLVCSLAIFAICRLYRIMLRFVGTDELNKSLIANLLSMVIAVMISTIFKIHLPISFFIIGGVFQLVLTTSIRFSYRFYNSKIVNRKSANSKTKNVMIIGAGEAGRIIIKELKSSDKISRNPVCVIDDNRNKWNRYIEGVPVVGGRDDILLNVKKYNVNEILLAIPSIDSKNQKEILSICNESGCNIKMLPGVYQLIKGDILTTKIKDIDVEDLLGREPIKINNEEVFNELEGKTILVTGGGGSIGSELCRQIAEHKPGHLIIFDIYENNAYDIEQELKRKHKDNLKITALIGSVRDTIRINQVFEEYRPDVVYHAAAHKHVPLMETSPSEAIKNNVIGTYKTALAAMKNGTEKFVLISTDKAVNPTNIMGASKRLCEMVIQTMDYVTVTKNTSILRVLEMHTRTKGVEIDNPQTRYVAVRFGNVLGSNGSVIPLFKKQIENGGPVTVTHPDIIRYFMTIPEAVSLVLQSGCYANGGEIFVLDMGEPVKIDSLARNLIKLSGLKPDEDIKIEYTGLRPGEKLYEEKLMSEEGLEKTDNDLIHIGKPIEFDRAQFMTDLSELAKKAYVNDGDIVNCVERIVPTFKHTKNSALTLMYITNNPEVAKIADECGVDRIFIDLETLGKEERQKGYDSVKSKHSLGDIAKCKKVLKNSKLLVRVNPINENSKFEIDTSIENGADIIMLPYYKTIEEVKEFIKLVNKRCKTMLLLETKEAHQILEKTLEIEGIDEVHIGLNDLHLSYKKDFMFELLIDGTVEDIVTKLKNKGMTFGFGGIAKLQGGAVPAEYIICEHKHLGSSIAILSRSFCNADKTESLDEVRQIFSEELKKIRDYEKTISLENEEFFVMQRKELVSKIEEVVKINKDKK